MKLKKTAFEHKCEEEEEDKIEKGADKKCAHILSPSHI